jgi:outer membrane receptor protein involved in Fe transport
MRSIAGFRPSAQRGQIVKLATLPGYVVADLHLAKRFEIKGAPVVKWVKVSFDIDNLFNKYYIQFSQTSFYENYNFQQTFFEYPGAPRSFFGKIDVGF